VAEAQIVLETSVLLAYAKGSEWVGEHLTRAAQDAEDVVVPALCLAEAYRRTDSEGWHMLDVLAVHPSVVVTPVERDMCSVLGGWSRTMRTMDLAQAAIEAASRPMAPVMTDKPELVRKHLPEEWPVVEL
jgi:hypothetical protein